MYQEEVEDFIRDLYCRSEKIDPPEFRSWALLQLTHIIDFDAALWGTGNLGSSDFHYWEHLGLDQQYGHMLAKTLAINPIKQAALQQLEHPIAMDEVFPDDKFFKSELYINLFEPYGISRILATVHRESSGGLYSLISLYRFEREALFDDRDKHLMSRLVFHLAASANHNYFLHLSKEKSGAAAICDRMGILWYIQAQAKDLLARAGVDLAKAFPLDGEPNFVKNGVRIEIESMGELFKIICRDESPMDQLTDRERQIVSWIVKGLTFKEVARELGVAPSTISNHLYRIYKKLDITSRSELAKMTMPS